MTASDPLVSIIIPAYNAERYIRETLLSITNQSYKNIEVLVVDDGSTDNTRNIVIQEFPAIKYYYQNNSGGCSSPRNTGLKYSGGDFITFFDSDDIMYPDKISNQVNFLNNYPDIDIIYCDYINFFDFQNQTTSHFKTCTLLQPYFGFTSDHISDFTIDPYNTRYILINENFAISGSPLFRRSVFDITDNFDSELKASEDFDLHYRAALHFNTGITSFVGFKRRLHDNNMSLNHALILKYKYLSRKKLLELETSYHLRKLLSARIRDYLLQLGAHYIGKNALSAFGNTLHSIRYGGICRPIFYKNLIKICLPKQFYIHNFLR